MKRNLIFVVLVMIGLASNACAQEVAIGEIIEKANLAAYYTAKDGISDVNMTIKDAQGRERVRELRILRLTVERGGEQKFYVYFKKPADVAKMVFMVNKHIDRDDDRWLYLPALDLVRRIASSDKRSSFVGSHFVYEDVSGRSIKEDTHELMETDDKYYKVKSVPKKEKSAEFAYYYLWIDKANFIPMKAEYYNTQNQLTRSVEALEVKDIQGYPTVIKSIAKDLERGGETIIHFNSIQYDVGLTDDIFAERYLRRAPVEWIK